MIRFRSPTPHRVSLLIVDDDDVDIMAVKRAVKKLELGNPVLTAHNGIEALRILRGDEQQDQLSAPYVILLDLNMPLMNGIEFLDELRRDENLRDSVVFVLTTSGSADDVRRAYRRNVAGYIVKAGCDATYLNAMLMLESYCAVVELPGVA